MNNDAKKLIDRLAREHSLSKEDYAFLVRAQDEETAAYAGALAAGVRREVYGTDVYIRGLIEIGNICRNDCLYCGIRRSNTRADRYRLTEDEIFECACEGYTLGFRTFVMQGGEDGTFGVDSICRTVRRIKRKFPDCAVTLSLGEFPREDYEAMFAAGADRYLLRHETADRTHYEKLAEDLKFIETFRPAMCGIGPFIPQKDTPFGDRLAGTAEQTVYLLSLLRLMQPKLLLPATTALGTILPDGRERGLAAGANVVMPNLSPLSVRKKYALYDGKLCTGEEAAQCIGCLSRRVQSVGANIVIDRGDVKS